MQKGPACGSFLFSNFSQLLSMSVADFDNGHSISSGSRNGDHRVSHRDWINKRKHPAIDIRNRATSTRSSGSTRRNCKAVPSNDGSHHSTTANRIDCCGTIGSPVHVLCLSTVDQHHIPWCSSTADHGTAGLTLEHPHCIRISLCVESQIAGSDLEVGCKIDSGLQGQATEFTARSIGRISTSAAANQFVECVSDVRSHSGEFYTLVWAGRVVCENRAANCANVRACHFAICNASRIMQSRDGRRRSSAGIPGNLRQCTGIVYRDATSRAKTRCCTKSDWSLHFAGTVVGGEGPGFVCRQRIA